MRDNPRFHYAIKICKELGIDDPIWWMNNTDPRILDLWIADAIFEEESEGPKMRNPELVLGDILRKTGGVPNG